MPSNSTRPLVFISYAHLDEPDPPEDLAAGKIRWLSFVMRFLRPGEKGRRYEVWMDRLMPGGADWSPEIEAKARACDIFVLLVSTNSTGSDYILDKEIPIVRERQRNNDGVYFYPLLLDWTPKAGLAQVDDKNLRPRDAKPLFSLSPSERSRAMTEAADEIADVAKAIEDKKTAAAAEKAPAVALEGMASILAPLARQPPGLHNFEIEGITPIRPEPAHPAVLAIAGLPETGYERLVGRDAELTRLDEAWSDGKTAILSLIGEGGAGKSALVNEWLKRLRADGYRGAEAVLGWSFYSQGSKERATAADEFLNWALAQLGVKLQTTSASAKGEAIAEALASRRVLLVLDGVEPLQHGPGPQAGQLKDQGLRALLRRFAAAAPKADHSLIVLTSRVAVADIRRFKDDAAPVIDVERLSEEAGAELLRDNYVWGIDKELRAASREFGGHPLALTLLASLIRETQNGDVRRRDHIRLLGDDDDPLHGHARRVMKSYEKEWLAGQPVLLAILHCVGLFDRPASGDCLKALRGKPAIAGPTGPLVELGESAWRRRIASLRGAFGAPRVKPPIAGLTDALADLTEEQWRRAVERLRDVRLLAPVDPSGPDALDAHPLVREWFGERLRATNEPAWKAAHGRLYEHLRDTTKEGPTPTLADLGPLYHAIAHGCRAGRHREALNEVYVGRICRRYPNGQNEFYASGTLGAFGSNLAAISWFFDRPYETPSAALSPPDRSWVLSEAGNGLRAQGRLMESLPTARASLRFYEEARRWTNAAIASAVLSDTELLFGEVEDAVAMAEKAAGYAERARDRAQMVVAKTTQGTALVAAGAWRKAEGLFGDAERLQHQYDPQHPLLFTGRGYQYCDLIISQGRPAEARDRATQTLEIARRNNWILFIALDTLTLGRAHRGLALLRPASGPSPEPASVDVDAASARFDEAVAGLRGAGQNGHVARGLIARSAFRRSIGDWGGAARDLDEAHEFAEPGPMRLFLCNIALERAQLALARREAFAPLGGLAGAHPPPVSPDAAAASALRDEARKQLDMARKLISTCGYHRRDEELAELDAVVAGARRFASLPPRV